MKLSYAVALLVSTNAVKVAHAPTGHLVEQDFADAVLGEVSIRFLIRIS